MDAETMLEDLVNLGIQYADESLTMDDRNQLPLRHDKMIADLLPLIRAGLALQRLEKWQDAGPDRWSDRDVINGRVRFTLHDPDAEHVGRGATLVDAINAALDAACVLCRVRDDYGTRRHRLPLFLAKGRRVRWLIRNVCFGDI